MIHLMNLDDVTELKGYRKWGGLELDNPSQYIMDKLNECPTDSIYFGVDSQRRGEKTVYVIAIVLHSKVNPRGGHVVYKKMTQKRFEGTKSGIFQKLTLEANIVYKEICSFVKEMRDLGYNQWDRLELHVDFNTQKGTGSNDAYLAHIGWLKGLGLSVHVKPLSYASMAADKILKPNGYRRRHRKRGGNKPKPHVRTKPFKKKGE